MQSFETGLYLDPTGSWTSRTELALDFPNTVRATQFKIHRRLKNTFTVIVCQPTNAAGQSLHRTGTSLVPGEVAPAQRRPLLR